MKINFISDFCFPGGLAVHQGEMALRLEAMYGHEMRICVPWPLPYDIPEHRIFIEKAYATGQMSEIFEPLRMLVLIHSTDELGKILASGDINHFHGTFSTNRKFLGDAIRICEKMKNTVYTFHSEDFNPYCNSERAELNFRIGSMRKLCAVSDRVKAKTQELFPAREISVIHNGVSELHLAAFNHDPFTVLFVARLNYTKGIEAVLDFAAKIRNSEIRLVIVGIAEFDSRYDAILGELCRNSPNIIWINRPLSRKELFHLYEDSDVFYFPSHMEGGPLVVFEAMRFGAVPVVTPTGCVNDFVTHGKNGFIFKADDFYGQHEIIFHLWKNPEMLQRMKKEACSSPLPTWEQGAEKLNNLYRTIIPS